MRHRLGEADHRELGGAVGAETRVSAFSSDRGDVDDHPAAGLAQHGKGRARGQKDSLDVHTEQAVPVALLVGGQGSGLEQPGVVHQHVGAPEGLGRRADQVLAGRRVGDIHLDRGRLASVLPDGFGRRLQLLLGGQPVGPASRLACGQGAEVPQDHSGALPGKALGDPPPDAARASRHDDRPAPNFHLCLLHPTARVYRGGQVQTRCNARPSSAIKASPAAVGCKSRPRGVPAVGRSSLKGCLDTIRSRSLREAVAAGEQMATDCRKYPRLRIDAEVSIARVASRNIPGRTVDLSRGGLRLACIDLDAVVGELVRVNLDLDGVRVSIVGKVVRITAMDSFVREIALAFVDVDAETGDLLQLYFEVAGGVGPAW